MKSRTILWLMLFVSATSAVSYLWLVASKKPNEMWIVIDASKPPPPPKDDSAAELKVALDRIDEFYPSEILRSCQVRRFVAEDASLTGAESLRVSLDWISAQQINCILRKSNELNVRVQFSSNASGSL
jgi:hypothetical protein